MVNSLNVLFSCFIVLYSLICTFFIWFPSSFSFSTHHSAIFRSESFSIFSPSLYPSTTYFFLLSNHSQLYILAFTHSLFSGSVLTCEFTFFSGGYMEIFVHRSRQFPTSLLPTFQCTSRLPCQYHLLPSILSSSLLTALLQSLHPPLFCPAAQ